MKEYLKLGWKGFILLMFVAAGMITVELYALSQGINGTGVVAFAGGMGAVFSFGLVRRK